MSHIFVIFLWSDFCPSLQNEVQTPWQVIIITSPLPSHTLRCIPVLFHSYSLLHLLGKSPLFASILFLDDEIVFSVSFIPPFKQNDHSSKQNSNFTFCKISSAYLFLCWKTCYSQFKYYSACELKPQNTYTNFNIFLKNNFCF